MLVGPLWIHFGAHLIEISYHSLSGPPCVGFTTERGKKDFNYNYNYNKVDPERESIGKNRKNNKPHLPLYRKKFITILLCWEL